MMRALAVLLLPALAACVAVTNAESANIMRRETEMHMSAGGSMSVKKSKPTFRAYTRDEMIRNLEAPQDGSRTGDLCDYAYTAGVENTVACQKPNQQKLIEEIAMCQEAAREACPCPTPCANETTWFNSAESCLGSPFTLADTEFEKHPWRCFMAPGSNKWFFNPQGDEPSTDTAVNAAWQGGTPICVEVEYINGTDGSTECGNDLYENILNEADCRTAATCLSKCEVGQFRVMNGTDENEVPKGCHIRPDDCVAFNVATEHPTAATIIGKPLCQIKAEHAPAPPPAAPASAF